MNSDLLFLFPVIFWVVYKKKLALFSAMSLSQSSLHFFLQDSYLVLDKLPPEYDSRVKAMEVPGSGRSLHGRTWHEGMGRIESGTLW